MAEFVPGAKGAEARRPKPERNPNTEIRKRSALREAGLNGQIGGKGFAHVLSGFGFAFRASDFGKFGEKN
jgi:hypothetical protein